jgi:hypothetical protein
MKIIKNLTVNVTYRVKLDNVEVPDDVYDSLANATIGVESSPIPVFIFR